MPLGSHPHVITIVPAAKRKGCRIGATKSRRPKLGASAWGKLEEQLMFEAHVAVTAKKTEGYQNEKETFGKPKLVMSSGPIRSYLVPIMRLETGCTPHT